MKFDLFSVTDKDRVHAISTTLEESEPNSSYYLMLVLAVTMATIGLFLDQVTIVIGSMLIAPVISPVVSFSLGVTLADFEILKKSLRTVIISTFVAFVTGTLITLFIDPLKFPINNEILSRTEPSMMYFLVAFIAGIAAAFAKAKENLSITLPGVAISTALVPPLAVVGIGVGRWDWMILSNSFLLFLANILGIAMAALIVFSLLDLHKKKSVVNGKKK
jgi:uncharacterized hydrophobic protein (TIGR00341 family)